MNTLQFLPFYNLDDREFSLVVGYWSRHIHELMGLDLYNLLPNPDKNDEANPDLMFINPQSEYYDVLKLDNILCKAQGKGTVPLKGKLTVSTRNSILDPQSFRESSFEFRFSRIEFRVSSFEFRDTRRNFRGSRTELLRKRFNSRKQNNSDERNN